MTFFYVFWFIYIALRFLSSLVKICDNSYGYNKYQYTTSVKIIAFIILAILYSVFVGVNILIHNIVPSNIVHCILFILLVFGIISFN